MAKAIRIRISHDRLDSLCGLCKEMQEEFKPETDHDKLLKEHMQEFSEKISNMLLRNQEKYTMVMSGSESTAFYQLWKKLDIRNDAYANIIVGSLLHKMSALATL